MKDKIEEWLKDQEEKVAAMKHWAFTAIKNGNLASEYWDDGPYPPMEKLLALVRVYREELGPCICDRQHQYTCSQCEGDATAKEIIK